MPSTHLTELTDDQLESEYKSLHQSIYITDCYSISDLIAYELIGQELSRRNIAVVKTIEFVEA